MNFEENRFLENLGEKTGFVVAYLISSTILFFILSFLNKLPETWTFFHVAGVLAAISSVGIALRKLL